MTGWATSPRRPRAAWCTGPPLTSCSTWASPGTATWPTCWPRPPAPPPGFAAVICEDIERSGRDTFNALKLEKQLAEAGIPLFATDEPIDIGGMNATTLLVRRVKQGIAEWYRFQIKEKAWKGLREHSLAGWNIGPRPVRLPGRESPPPGSGQGRPGPHQIPADHRPAARARRRADFHVADSGQAGHARHHRPAERRPGRLPAAPGTRMEHDHRLRDPGQPQVYRAHGVRPAPHHRRPHPLHPALRMALVTRTRPPLHHHP